MDKTTIEQGEPTEEQIDNACMWFRHDFGLFDEEEKKIARFHAKEWLRAWRKAFDLLN
jgi:hypothetical protein